jgi:flagellar basal body-associated protein FliL
MALNALVSKILLIVNAVGMLACAGLVYYADSSIKPPQINPEDEWKKLMEKGIEQARIAPVPVPKIILNLNSGANNLKFLELEMDVLTFSEAQKEVIKNSHAIIYDTTVDICGNMESGELLSLSGKILLENRLRENINQKLGEKMIKEIFFSRYIVQ